MATALFPKVTEHAPVILLISGGEKESEKIASLLPHGMAERVNLCEFPVEAWDRMLTPWPDDTCMKGRHFAGEAGDTLRALEEQVISPLDNVCPGHGPVIPAGYSLAGLFALWSLYERPDLFGGAVCCSGSLWYPGWREYAEKHDLSGDKAVYLSLGDREPCTKHPWLKRSGEAMETQHALLETAGCRTTFVWEQGGHFNDPETRLARGIAWVTENITAFSA